MPLIGRSPNQHFREAFGDENGIPYQMVLYQRMINRVAQSQGVHFFIEVLLCCVSESLTRLETDQKAHSANYTGGEKAGQSWTDRVLGVKQTQDVPASLPQDQQEGVDEDEWVSVEGPPPPNLHRTPLLK